MPVAASADIGVVCTAPPSTLALAGYMIPLEETSRCAAIARGLWSVALNSQPITRQG
jgi:hypothetical protein